MRKHRSTTAPTPAPLTPDPSRVPEYVTSLSIAELESLRKENRDLRKELAHLRNKHEVIENALHRQLSQTQNLLTIWKQTFETLDKPLSPSERK